LVCSWQFLPGRARGEPEVAEIVVVRGKNARRKGLAPSRRHEDRSQEMTKNREMALHPRDLRDERRLGAFQQEEVNTQFWVER